MRETVSLGLEDDVALVERIWDAEEPNGVTEASI
jgi:hypothetical protein